MQFYSTCLFLLCAFAAFAQSPNALNYQAVLRDASGVVSQNKAVQVKFTIRSGAANGSSVYSENHNATTNAYGLINLQIGTGTVTSGNFSAINWASGAYFLEVSLDGVAAGAQQLASVPFSLYAQNAASSAVLKDADGDTRVSVEQAPNENQIRFQVAGTEFARMDGKTLHLNAPNDNLFVGKDAGISNTNGSGNTFLGTNAGKSNVGGVNNTFLGLEAGLNNTTGIENTFLGRHAGRANAGGVGNTFVGKGAGLSNTSARWNTFIGKEAGSDNTTGENNVFLGERTGTSNKTGNNNTYLGSQAGYFSTGSGNIFLGYQAGANETGDNKLYIHNSNTATPLIYGDFSKNELNISGKLGVGINPPLEKLHIKGGNLRVDDGEFQSWGEIHLRPDVDNSGDSYVNLYGRAGVNYAYANVSMSVFNKGKYPFIFSAVNSNQSPILSVGEDASVNVYGSFSVANGSKNFILDHPLDPANKSLAHNAVEGPDYITFYHGTVALDADGSAWAQLPDYFEALNKDFHYQLTCVGGYAPVFVEKEIAGNRFKIAGGHAGMKVCWQVTATRNDPWAQGHPYQAEISKENENAGKYWYPEGYGQSREARMYSLQKREPK